MSFLGKKLTPNTIAFLFKTIQIAVLDNRGKGWENKAEKRLRGVGVKKKGYGSVPLYSKTFPYFPVSTLFRKRFDTPTRPLYNSIMEVRLWPIKKK
jgi:hypothetical protein